MSSFSLGRDDSRILESDGEDATPLVSATGQSALAVVPELFARNRTYDSEVHHDLLVQPDRSSVSASPSGPQSDFQFVPGDQAQGYGTPPLTGQAPPPEHGTFPGNYLAHEYASNSVYPVTISGPVEQSSFTPALPQDHRPTAHGLASMQWKSDPYLYQGSYAVAEHSYHWNTAGAPMEGRLLPGQGEIGVPPPQAEHLVAVHDASRTSTDLHLLHIPYSYPNAALPNLDFAPGFVGLELINRPSTGSNSPVFGAAWEQHPHHHSALQNDQGVWGLGGFELPLPARSHGHGVADTAPSPDLPSLDDRATIRSIHAAVRNAYGEGEENATWATVLGNVLRRFGRQDGLEKRALDGYIIDCQDEYLRSNPEFQSYLRKRTSNVLNDRRRFEKVNGRWKAL